ncbi:hypothetical protein AMS68_002212 [Peltaster fructicola]|uniref:NAD(P)-binding protein n=1 Tax=Peltaster fructicola TaxID=286661 RepID=A0A6H0XPY6_9PEZI|nr:hypothetical protein AMS68_002212 [Peltaster fructicola]
MPPVLRPLAPSEAKSRFIDHLELSRSDRQHLYALMKAEAVEAWQRLQLDRSALLPNLQHNAAIQPPFSNSQISETAMHREIMLVYRQASAETRPCYDLAQNTDSTEAENWVIRWCLWHVFRDRDRRKKSRHTVIVGTTHHAEQRQQQQQQQHDRASWISKDSLLSAQNATLASTDQRPVILPYDPVRESTARSAVNEFAQFSRCSFHPIELDVTSDASIQAAVKAIGDQFGRLDVLINNAGIAVASSDLTDYRRSFNDTLNTNVTSVGLLTAACIPLLTKSGHRQVITISSGRASMHALVEGTLPPTRVLAYTVSKVAVNALTLEMRKLYPQVTFQCANPGHCSTALNGFKGTKDPADGAQVVVELALAEVGSYAEGFWEHSDEGMRQMRW